MEEDTWETFNFDYGDSKYTIEAYANCFSITTKVLGGCWAHISTVQIVNGQLEWCGHYLLNAEIKDYCEKLLRNRLYW